MMDLGDSYSALGQHQKAYDLVKDIQNLGGGSHFNRLKELSLAEYAIEQGDVDTCLKHHSSFEEIKHTPSFFVSWADTHLSLAKRNAATNDWTTDAQFNQMTQQFDNHGVIRNRMDISLNQIELALMRGRPLTAKRVLDETSRLLPKLKKDLGMSEQLAHWQTQVDAQLSQHQPTESQLQDLENKLSDLPRGPRRSRALDQHGFGTIARRSTLDDSMVVGDESTTPSKRIHPRAR